MADLKPLTNKAALAFWNDKVKLSPSQYSKLTDEQKVKAFAVAGIAKGSELETVFQSLRKTIESGGSLGDFKRDIKEILQKRGWVGKRAWRVDNIYRTNVQTAYSVGRYGELIGSVKTRPFWRYSAVNDGGTRPLHWAQNGKVYRYDNKYWLVWYTPNGFGCRCKVTSLSQRDLDRLGIKAETEDPTNRLIEPVDRVTGAKLPARTMIPDRGFDHNPAISTWGGVVDTSTRPATWSTMENVATAASQNIKAMPRIKALPAKQLASGLTDSEYVKSFEDLYTKEQVMTDAIGDPAILSVRSYLGDITPGSETWTWGQNGRGESIPSVESLIKKPSEIWLVPEVNEAGKIRLTKRYLATWATDTGEVSMTADVANGVFQSVNATVAAEDLEALRQGARLYTAKGGGK